MIDVPAALSGSEERATSPPPVPLAPVHHVLRPGAGLTGRVVDRWGHPVEGVRVSAHWTSPTGLSSRYWLCHRTAAHVSVTDSEGLDPLSGLPTSGVSLELEASMGFPWDASPAFTEVLAPGTSRQPDIVIR